MQKTEFTQTILKTTVTLTKPDQESKPFCEREIPISFSVWKYSFPEDRRLYNQGPSNERTIDELLKAFQDFILELECYPEKIECYYESHNKTYEAYVSFKGFENEDRLVSALRMKGEKIHNWARIGFDFEGLTFRTR